MADVYFRPDGQNRFQIRSAANGTLPSAWLDQEYNRIYTYLNSIQTIGGMVSGSDWATVDVESTQVSTSSFSVEGDYTRAFEQGRAIRLTDDSDVRAYSHIKSATYVAGTNTTTVVLYDAIVPATIKAVDVGLIGKAAQPISSLNYITRTDTNYTVQASDQVILVDDSNIGSLTQVWDDGYVGSSASDGSYYALLIRLPVAGAFPGKMLCVKKIAGTYTTIVSAPFTHSQTIEDTSYTNTNTYTFQIYGDTAAKNRVTLKGIGDCYWLFSNGSRWYEITPEASETVKGVVRFATEEEMSLTAQQMADNEDLSKTLAVNPYQLDKAYMRTDGSNLRFASNFIYKNPNGTAALVNNNIVVYNGLGVNIPKGRDEDGVLKSEKLELAQNYTYSPVEVTEKTKLLFVRYDDNNDSVSLESILDKDYFACYGSPIIKDTTTGERIIWFDYSTNLLKESTDNGTNWTTFNGAGPICEYSGNGTYTTYIKQYSCIGFLTREDEDNIYRQALLNERVDFSAGVSMTNDSTLQFDALVVVNGWPADYNTTSLYVNGIMVWAGGVSENSARNRCGNARASKGDNIQFYYGNCTAYPILGAKR